MIKLPVTDTYRYNAQRAGMYTPCAICGKAIKTPTAGVHTWFGSDVVTPAEAAMLQKTEPMGDTGFQPIGADCLRNNPQLLPYVIR